MPAMQRYRTCEYCFLKREDALNLMRTFLFSAQGAAQAVEDGAVLGALFEKVQEKSQLPDLLVIYEAIRKARTTQVVKGSTSLRDIFHMHDGPQQQERDRQLSEQEPFEGFPNRWADP